MHVNTMYPSSPIVALELTFNRQTTTSVRKENERGRRTGAVHHKTRAVDARVYPRYFSGVSVCCSQPLLVVFK